MGQNSLASDGDGGGAGYFGGSEAVRRGKSSKNAGKCAGFSGKRPGPMTGNRREPTTASQRKVDKLCPEQGSHGWGRSRRRRRENRGKGERERAKKGTLRPAEAEGIPTINVAVSEKIANFFTNTALILQGKNSGYLVKND